MKAHLEKKEKTLPDSRQVDVVVFIPHTANSSLKNLLQLTDDKITKPLNVGSSISSVLVKKNPWYQMNGGCQTISCRQEGVVYEIKCAICEE